MDSDDDVLLSSSPVGSSPQVHQRKLKRLKKAIRVSTDSPTESPGIDDLEVEAKSLESEALRFGDSEEQLPIGSGSQEFSGGDALDSGFGDLVGDEEGSGAKRALDFDSFAEEFDEIGEDRSKEIEEAKEEVRMEELNEKQPSPDHLVEEKEKKKKKKRKERIDSGGDDDDDKKMKEKPSYKRKLEKEMQENLKQLLAESQRMLRESSDATFKPVPLVQKPISSVLEKIRQRKLEISKTSVSYNRVSSIIDDGESSREISVEQNIEPISEKENGDVRVPEASNTDTVACPVENVSQTDKLCEDETNNSVTQSREKVTQMAIDEESKQEFGGPVDDTQDLFSDSQTSDSKYEAPSSPMEGVLAPSVYPLNLQLDSAPPDDVSSDEEDYDKENIDPFPRGLTGLSLSPTGDPVKAFVDDEAEEEDDSDNDLLRFKENDEDEDNDDDFEDLRDMIETGCEEKPIDNERRNELHQKWLEQQDAVGTENLLQKLKYGSKVREPTLIEEEEDQEDDEVEESDDEGGEDLAPSSLVKMNLRKVKQTMHQMYTDDNDEYLSSDDEETEKKLTKQYLLEKAEEHVAFFSPAEDESSREVFGRIKKLNNAANNKKRAKTQSYFDMSLMGINKSISSKPSFLGRGSSGYASSSKKQASMLVRSFIFEREDSNSKSATSVSVESSSETIQIESRPRTISAKFISSQTRTYLQKPAPVANSETSLLDILKRKSFASKRCTVDNMVPETESILTSFKLTKKPAN